MKQLELTLTESEAKILLEAVLKREYEMAEICRSSDDGDLAAELENDLIELRLLLKSLRVRAVAIFGPSVMNLCREEP